jgi:hypothetical protein
LINAPGDACRGAASSGKIAAAVQQICDDADKTLAAFRADAARDELRARAERAERQADAYRDELTQLRAATGPVTDTTTASGTLPRARQATRQ